MFGECKMRIRRVRSLNESDFDILNREKWFVSEFNPKR